MSQRINLALTAENADLVSRYAKAQGKSATGAINAILFDFFLSNNMVGKEIKSEEVQLLTAILHELREQRR